jgi:hypothetical protein
MISAPSQLATATAAGQIQPRRASPLSVSFGNCDQLPSAADELLAAEWVWSSIGLA